MSRTELDLRRAQAEELKEVLQRGWLQPGIDEGEQRFWLTEVALELVRREGANAIVGLLTGEGLPPNSLGAIIEAYRPASRSEQAWEAIAPHLNHSNDYVVSAALRFLSSTPKRSKAVISRARELSSHESPLVRIAALGALARLGAADLGQLLLAALNDRDRAVREAALDLADDLAAEGELDSNMSSAILTRAKSDRSAEVRRFAGSRESLVEQARAAIQH